MDFDFSDEQQAIRELARKICSEASTDDRLRELDRGAVWYDDDLWRDLSAADLTTLTLPEDAGGSGHGVLEACLVLTEVGRSLAHVPMLPTLLMGGAPIAAFGTPEQRERWLRGAGDARAVFTAALEEVGNDDPARPRTRAVKAAGGWRVSGEKVCVPAAHLARCILLPARLESGEVGVFLVESDGPGVQLERQVTSNFEPHGRLLLEDAAVGEASLLGGSFQGAAQVDWICQRALVGICAVQLGVAEEALRRTAEYTSQRVQFDRPIASFQAVAVQAANAYIDVDCIRTTMLQAAWRLSAGLPAAAETAAAKWWASRGGHRVVHACQHLHGGIGADVDYPIHRYFLWAKQLDQMLGGASRQLDRLGDLLAVDSTARPTKDRV